MYGNDGTIPIIGNVQSFTSNWELGCVYTALVGGQIIAGRLIVPIPNITHISSITVNLWFGTTKV